jgi:hypothetical protein
MGSSTVASRQRDVLRLTGLLILALSLAAVALWPPVSSATSDPRAQAQRLCSKIGGFFDPRYTPPSWVCVKGVPDFTDRDKAQAGRLCARQGGTFLSGFDSQLYFLNCDVT